MRYVYFQVSANYPDVGAQELNAFIACHAVISISEEFVADGTNSFWSVRVAVTDNEVKNMDSLAKSPTIDYRDVLSPEVFAVYAKLRTLRNDIAKQQSIPPYAVFKNEQLAKIAELKNPTKQSISAIEGIGEKRMELYVERFLQILINNNG